ncbi:hypothetical protein [Streptomyces sp. AM 2-1-1]|uniref:hypothetical protein n=1 Tax=Streptomyces sp. AM 2-1-1 TaxID=3028709 RepID=UPI0023B8A8A3|nr:hypothetical protein [Streptomyces sp. AM 2-1-1]WEH43988.1 hypothetical protein PZB77_30975 [Streptomyces sp. AM 2-1-1]
MRARLGGAVRALLSADGLQGAPDSVRLAVLVLASRTPWETGEVEIYTRELGRWIGLSKSHTANAVVPALRNSGVVAAETAEGEFTQDDGLLCEVEPMKAARGVVGHPLNLAKKELATFLALMEAVMAPGWARRDRSVTPAGLLGERTGRGAATERLALLLLVLEARENGWVRLRGGRVDTQRGRPVATLARLLGCTVWVAEGVLERLEAMELVVRPRVKTGSKLNHRARLVVPAVAAAHGRRAALRVVEERAEAPDPGFSDPGATVGPSEPLGAEEEVQVSSPEEGGFPEFSDPGVTGTLHTDHTHLVPPVGSLQVSGGFSGEGRGAEGPLPEDACEREDQAADGEDAAAVPGPRSAEVGPLRGEQPKKSPADDREEQPAARPGAGARPQAVRGEKAQQQRRVDLPEESGLRVALGPVSWLWQGLSKFQQARVQQAAEAELGRLEGWTGQQELAARRLASRLAARLDETGGEALVDRPYGWLIGRGLVQRQACADRRCDDGTRLDTGAACESCANVLHIRRAHRARIAAEVDQELPGLDDAARRQAVEERLRALTAVDAERFVRRREEARVREAEREAARAAARERAELERQAAAVAATVRQALACEDCGQTGAGGLCEACGCRRETETLTARAVQLVAARTLDPAASAADVAALNVRVRTAIDRKVAAEWAQFLEITDPAELEDDQERAGLAAALTAHSTVQQITDQAAASALAAFGRTDEADTEADRAYRTEQGRRWFQHNPTGEAAVAAATKASATARNRVAQHLLAVRLEQLREQATTVRPTGQTGAGSWTDRLPELAARTLGGATAGVVIA